MCEDHVNYELLLFKQLGIKAYYNSSDVLDHAWSVVKVKNVVGKTLWIPFDYGIGPCTDADGNYFLGGKRRFCKEEKNHTAPVKSGNFLKKKK